MTHFAPIQQVYSQQEHTRREVAAYYGIEPSYGYHNGYRSPFAPQKKFAPQDVFEPSPPKKFTPEAAQQTLPEPRDAAPVAAGPPSAAESPLSSEASVPAEEEAAADPFEQLMSQYPCYKHMFKNMGLLTANGVSFPHETKLITSKSQEEIAKEKAVQQLQVQCVMAGADAILGLRCEFLAQPAIGVCICTAYGTAVKYNLYGM